MRQGPRSSAAEELPQCCSDRIPDGTVYQDYRVPDHVTALGSDAGCSKEFSKASGIKAAAARCLQREPERDRRPTRTVSVTIMNPVYSPAPTGVPFTNTKGIGYPAGFPVGYAAAAPAYTPNVYAGANPAFPSGYAPGTPFKMSCSPNTGTVPPYSSSPSPYPAAVYPVRSTYAQQNPYAQALIPSQQQGTYYTQPLWDHHGHVCWNFVDNSITSACRPPPCHDAHVSASWHTQLQLRAPAVVKRGKRQRMVDMHSHSTPVFFALGEDLICQRLQPVTLLPA
ncbi:myelin-associated neurite-outgrowth inhibitor isoform X1 [Lates japonicus]|uniref:Myelin-associated neurite-outgrowth inhibitor isoform X1 n=1 Tax=Lates japonicus TaxID=270547 RepID=A0AAD3R4D4_LATJO|nr:myelin-associated neurite-outgrowth inhibitor isoform X1 [Lates japonicus]